MLVSIMLFAGKFLVGGIFLQSYLFEDHPRPHYDAHPHHDDHPHYDDQDARTMRVRGPPSRPGGWDPHRERGEESVLRITPRLMNLFKGPK